MLRLYLLGPPRIELGEAPLHISRRKSLALLVYLAVTAKPHSRDELATLFYPDLDQSRARAYFRRDLGAINTRLSGEWLDTDRETVALNPHAGVWTDTAQFLQDLAASENRDHTDKSVLLVCLTQLTAAIDRYTNHFLAGFTLPDCPRFDEWQFFEAESLRQKLTGALDHIVADHLVLEEFAAAIPYARRWLDLDPLHELAHRQLMKLYALSGQQAAALRQYQVCEHLLRDELGVGPDEQTQALYETIKSRRLTAEAPDLAATQTASLQLIALPPFLADDELSGPPAPPFVGRERELGRLRDALESARSGSGQILFVVGEAGRGKSTLMNEFARRALDGDDHLVLASGFCNAITGVGDPYLPFREALGMLTGDVESQWAGGLLTAKHARRLWELMPIALPALVTHGPDLVGSLLPGHDLKERATAVGSNEAGWFTQIDRLTTAKPQSGLEQQQIFTQYATVIRAIAARRPLLLVIEDLHWVDLASSGLLFHLSREIGKSKILLVGTYRPEEITRIYSPSVLAADHAHHPLADVVRELKRQHGDIWVDLDEQAASESRAFVDAFLDTEPNHLGKAFRDAFYEQTRGHALFVVELLRTLQERGDLLQDAQGRWVEGQTIDWSDLPVKVEGAIEKRIDRLDKTLQRTLVVASILGEIFAAEVVARVEGLDERTVVHQLSGDLDKRHKLTSAHKFEWLVPGEQRLSIFRFRHHLFQQYLYNRLDEAERGYLHEAVGEALETLYENRTGEVAGQLAHHFQEAGLNAKAIKYWRQAGESAAAVSAHAEAADHYKRAIYLAEEVGLSDEERAALFIRLGGLLLVTKGDGAPEVGEAYQNAYDLSREAGQTPELFSALRGLAMFNKLSGETQTARALTKELLNLAEYLKEPLVISEASFAMGSLLFYAGEHGAAQAYLEQGIKSYNPEEHRSLTLHDDQDLGIANLSYSTLNLWLIGYPDKAALGCLELLDLAERLSHPYSLAMAHVWIGWTNILQGEGLKALEPAESAINIASEHGYALFEVVGTLLRCWALADLGRFEGVTGQMRQALDTMALALGTQLAPPMLSYLKADIHGKMGQIDEGLEMLTMAEAAIENTKQLFLGPEVHRLRGELRRRRGDPEADVEAEFQRAIELAKKQEARSLELRAAMSLVRLMQSQGRSEEAHQKLSSVYDWFSEGFETPDLQEARALLGE